VRIETIGDATLYLADCRDVLPMLGPVDVVITDPPYGVGLGQKVNNERTRVAYKSFVDTPEYVFDVAVPAVAKALALAKRGLVTPGIRNMWRYPQPKHVGSIYYPAAAGCNSWGFSCWQPIFYYGSDPYGARAHDSFQSVERADENGHPCPKPVNQMIWMVNRASLPTETVLDPFMGSGTTGVACANLGRKFIGIEMEPDYFNIACERIRAAYAQQRLFA
jgi:site-specific DNA-methyltransferase (adenine-specific)